MGCRCAERTDALRRARQQLTGGNVRAAVREIADVGRTFVEDARSGDLRRAAEQRLAAFKARRGR